MTTMSIAGLLVAGCVGALASSVRPDAVAVVGRGLTGGTRIHVVSRGDTATSIGARYGVGADVLIAENRLQAGRVLLEGQTLEIDNRHIVPSALEPGVVVINLPQRMLFHEESGVVTGLPVAVGRRTWPTPIASLTVVTRERNPTWDVPASILAEARRAGRDLPASVPPGPDNPLGRFWLGLSGGGVGIHGTNAPSSVYGAVSHGCMRLHPDDIEWLFGRVPLGTAVRTLYEPVLLTYTEMDVFLEVHPDVYRRAPGALETARALAEVAGVTSRVDWHAAGAVVAARHGVARVVTARDEDVRAPHPATGDEADRRSARER
jgi:L,D-transpeptidase ErfK/SrfK